METTQLQAVQVPITKLKPAPYNPRVLSKDELAKLKRSIKKFGFVEPVVANKRNSYIIGGHARTLAAQALGMTSLPVVWVDLDTPDEQALNIALNKIGGVFDNDALAEILSGLDLDLVEIAGFDENFMDELQPMPDMEPDIEKADKTKTPKFSTDDLRVLSKTYHPEQRQVIDAFLLWIDERQ